MTLYLGQKVKVIRPGDMNRGREGIIVHIWPDMKASQIQFANGWINSYYDRDLAPVEPATAFDRSLHAYLQQELRNEQQV